MGSGRFFAGRMGGALESRQWVKGRFGGGGRCVGANLRSRSRWDLLISLAGRAIAMREFRTWIFGSRSSWGLAL